METNENLPIYNINNTNHHKSPVILVSGHSKLHLYTAAVAKAGGIAIASYLPAYSDRYDGLLLAGGNDVNPAFYGEAPNGARDWDTARDECDVALIRAFAERNKPIFGICRGHQILNVAFGGTLVQALPDTPPHTIIKAPGGLHTVVAAKGTALFSLYGERLAVNTLHHEAVKDVAPGFRVTATSEPDGVIEGIEHTSRPFFGVQFHPERLIDGSDADAIDGNRIFRYFLSLCEKEKTR